MAPLDMAWTRTRRIRRQHQGDGGVGILREGLIRLGFILVAHGHHGAVLEQDGGR